MTLLADHCLHAFDTYELKNITFVHGGTAILRHVSDSALIHSITIVYYIINSRQWIQDAC